MKPLLFLRILTTAGFERIGASFISVLGFLWLIIEPAQLFFPEQLKLKWFGYFILVVVSLASAIILRFPRTKISKALSSPDSVIEIKVGDLFNESGHLIIGINDVFDTEIGEIISPNSIQGKFLEYIYNNEIDRLDQEIETALQPYIHQRKEDSHKIRGKRYRYPIGTTIVLGLPEKLYFLTAYGYMDNNFKVTSNADYIWRSLISVWEQVRLKGQGKSICIPIIGSGLARTNLPRMALVKLIITSFIVASKREFVSNKLTIVISSRSLDHVNLYDLEDFLASACF